MIIYAGRPPLPDTTSAATPPGFLERASVRALAGLELGVLASLLTEFWLLLFAWMTGWGWPGWGPVALHIATYGVAGAVLAMGTSTVGRTASLIVGFLYAVGLYWFMQHYLWNWFRVIGPVQAPGWAYWVAALLAGIGFALIPGRARSFERDFLLK